MEVILKVTVTPVPEDITAEDIRETAEFFLGQHVHPWWDGKGETPTVKVTIEN
jgi:hypothetical protein